MLIASQNDILLTLNFKYALFLIFYISPENIIFITKNKTPVSERLNNSFFGLNNISNINRRKYDLLKLAQYQLLLYEIEFKQYSRYMYSEYISFHKSYMADEQYLCRLSLTKLIIKENN